MNRNNGKHKKKLRQKPSKFQITIKFHGLYIFNCKEYVVIVFES